MRLVKKSTGSTFYLHLDLARVELDSKAPYLPVCVITLVLNVCCGCVFQIRNHILHLAYHLGSSVQQSLSLSQVVASNGQWHTVHMERSGKRVKLYMDSGEGPYYTETKGMTSGYRTLRIAPENVFGGALVSGNVIQNPDVTDYESCK